MIETTADPNQPGQPQMTIPLPREIYNCPQCSHYITPGMLVCPECQAVVYGEYLQGMAHAAQTLEEQERWPEARAAWRTMLDYLPASTSQADSVQQKIAAIDGRFAAKAQRSAKWKKRLGPLGPVLLVAVTKVKLLLFFLLKFKFILSFVAFFGIYWGLFGWKFGLGFTLSILVHEMGHYVAARRRGLKTDLPIFIPMMGAYVRWYSTGTTLADLAAISLAGPLFGLMFGIVCAGLAIWLRSPLFSALAHVSAWINLLNLIPFGWFDGAQATLALDRLQRGLLLATALIFFAITHEWVFLFIAAGMAFRVYERNTAPEPSTRTLIQFVLLFFLLGTLIWVFPDSGRRF